MTPMTDTALDALKAEAVKDGVILSHVAALIFYATDPQRYDLSYVDIPKAAALHAPAGGG